MLKKISKNKKYSGFSFIEAILATFLISTGMIVVTKLMATSLAESMSSRDQITGVLLAQEGIELVRNLRDNNWAKNRGTFHASSVFPNITTDNCIIYNGGLISCGGGVGSHILRFGTAANNFYNHNSASASNINTKFQRRIIITYNPAATTRDTATSATIASVVTWNNTTPPTNLSTCNTGTKCAYTQTTLTRWGGM